MYMAECEGTCFDGLWDMRSVLLANPLSTDRLWRYLSPLIHIVMSMCEGHIYT